MEFLHGIVALLAFVVMMLAGLTAWLYMKQARLLQAVNTLAIAMSTPPPPPPIPFEEIPAAAEPDVKHEEDDRVSVYEEDDASTAVSDVEDTIVPAPSPAHDEDTDFGKKTVAELRSLLSAKGIPFNKSDKKPTLISLIQATQ